MYETIRSILHPVRVIAVIVAIAVSCLVPSDPQAQMEDGNDPGGRSVFDPHDDGPVLEHQTIADPATLDGAAAERVYRSILPQMQAGFARSGDPIAYAYARWQRFNAVPYRSHQHGRVFVNNYANDIAAADYGRLRTVGSLPVGSLIVKDSFVVTATGIIRAGSLAIMEKMPAGFDPANGDWRYLVVGPDGALAGVAAGDGADPRMKQCAACHNGAPAGQDRLFHVPQSARR